MDTLSYKTVASNKTTVKKNWVIVDAKGKALGRVASEVASMIRGKHKTNFSPHVDCGDNVIVVNADGFTLSGKKWTEKLYISHSGYPGGQKTKTATEIKDKSSTILVEKAVRGMLPKNKLGRALFKNLFVYEGAEHPHEAQQPNKIEIKK